MFVACDESGVVPSDKYLVIGSAWISKKALCELEKKATELRINSKCWGEVEWHKTAGGLTPQLLQFYKDFIDLAFQDEKVLLHFIVVKKDLLRMSEFHQQSEELVKYKFMHLLLSRHGKRLLTTSAQKKDMHIIYDSFQQSKKSQAGKWSLKMRAYIESYLGESIDHVQPCNSHISSLVQICDLVTGAIGTSWNVSPSKIHPHKKEIMEHIEKRIGKGLRAPTALTDRDFNVWVWRPRGSI